MHSRYILTWRQINKTTCGQARLLPLSSPGVSASSADGRSVWRFCWSADQRIEVEISVFFLRTAKPSRADVTSVVYARQHHPRTARFQLNDITGLEHLCHSLILADPT